MLFLLACASDPEPASEPAPEPVVDEPVEPALDDVEPEPLSIDPIEEGPDGSVDEETAGDGSVDEETAEADDEAPLPTPLDLLDETAWSDRQEIVNELSGLTVGQSVLLLEDAVLEGIPCKGGARVEATNNTAWSCQLSEPTKIGEWPMSRGTHVWVYPGGQALQSATFADLQSPRESVTIDGVPCLSRASLHPGGTVASCTLARGAQVGGIALPARTDITLRDDGGLVDAIVYDTTRIAGVSYEAGLILFDGAGKVAGHQPGVFGD